VRRAEIRALVLAFAGALVLAACGWDPSRPFEREAPEVKQATSALDAGDALAATTLLEDYLNTGPCAEGQIGASTRLTKKPDGTFDLGLALFRIGESYGRRFGDEEVDSGIEDINAKSREAQIECALRIVRTIAEDESVPLELRARARYLEGNLHFMAKRYEEAVKAYDLALTIAPGVVDAGDPVGRDAAWNRAIALRRKEDKDKPDASDKGDAGSDAKSDATSDGGGDGGDGGSDSGGDGGGDSGKDSAGEGGGAGNDSGAPDGGDDASKPPPPPPPSDAPDAASPPPPQSNQDDRILDQLERAPTVQQEAAKKAASQRRVRGTADK
jgi:tetratricopeptide (TPR) repeat protein